jgi:hypothetical protein
MTEATSILRGIVRGGLTPGHHAALIDLLGHQSRRISSHLILNIGEACIERWPLTVADYNQPQGDTGAKIPVKFTLRNDMYPRLYHRYKSLAPGIRTTVILNLLNRYADLARVDSAGVSAALRELAQKQNDAPEAEPQTGNDVSNGKTVGHQVIEPAAVASIIADLPKEPELDPEPDVDPLSLINSGL